MSSSYGASGFSSDVLNGVSLDDYRRYGVFELSSQYASLELDGR
jgi:hypothetical protein